MEYFADAERNIARCRIVLSVVAIVTVFVDPTEPALTRWFALRGGPFSLDPGALAAMLAHLAYSIVVYRALGNPHVSADRIATVTTWGDLLFGAAIALFTEGATSPFYVFFAFAVLTAGFRGGLRRTLLATATGVTMYLCLILVTAPGNLNFYIMRPVYLAITGYLVGYMGQQRLDLEEKIIGLEAAEQRQHIARALHDGYTQALAGITLRLETCRELMRRGRQDDAFSELTDLQTGVTREYDELRTYIRSLAELDAGERSRDHGDQTQFSVHADFCGPLVFVEHALHILLEGARNIARHAHAHFGMLAARTADDHLSISICDDGIGFPANHEPPWSIASRVAELGGEIAIRNGSGGAQLIIELPRT